VVEQCITCRWKLVARHSFHKHADSHVIAAAGSNCSIDFADKLFCILYSLVTEYRAASKASEEIGMYLRNLTACLLGVSSEIGRRIVSCQGMEAWQHLKNFRVHLKVLHNGTDWDKFTFLGCPSLPPDLVTGHHMKVCYQHDKDVSVSGRHNDTGRRSSNTVKC